MTLRDALLEAVPETLDAVTLVDTLLAHPAVKKWLWHRDEAMVAMYEALTAVQRSVLIDGEHAPTISEARRNVRRADA